MPMRDQVRPPLRDRRQWESFHALWPAAIVLRLAPLLPTGYVVAPRVRLGVESDLDEPDECEVQIFDERDGGQTLVAAIEIVSPRNKDRPDSRAEFARKAVSLLRAGVCVSIVDLVANRHFNLYADALDLLGLTDAALADPKPSVYSATCRRRSAARRKALTDFWFYPLAVGQPLPPLPLWLDEHTCLSVDLEATYEETCGALSIS